jgi:cytochrome b561
MFPYPMRIIHWTMAAGVLTCFALVEIGRYVSKPTKQKLMMYHKSIGLTMLVLIFPRVFLRLTRKLPPAVPGPWWEHLAAEASHYLLYAALFAMPITGLSMLYLGGKEIPFFGLFEIEGKEVDASQASLSKSIRKVHKLMGTLFEVLVPVHIGAVGYHVIFKGQNIIKRLHPFRP